MINFFSQPVPSWLVPASPAVRTSPPDDKIGSRKFYDLSIMIFKFLLLNFAYADWRENFKEFGDWVLRRADSLPAACQTMNDEFFPAFLADAKNQAYFCLAFEGKESDEMMNSAGEVFRALYCQDSADLGFACSPDSSLILAKAVSTFPDRVMFGIEVENMLILYFNF